jgi:hypothetical protein
MTTGVRNKWLDHAKLVDSLDAIDEALMEAWAADSTIGDFLKNLPDSLKNDFMKYLLGTPIKTSKGFQINLEIPD